ncbi:hypothetical protein [Streptomyces sp. NPDC047841]
MARSSTEDGRALSLSRCDGQFLDRFVTDLASTEAAGSIALGHRLGL